MRAFLQVSSAVLLLLLSMRSTSFAASATWTGITNGDWDTITNWTAAPVPNGAMDTATFDTSGTTSIFLSTNVTLDGAVFNFGASAYTITANSGSLDFKGAGVTNNSGVTQNFATTSTIKFENSATAGSMTAYTNNSGGSTQFTNSSTAGNATITNSGAGSYTLFSDTASGGNATLINNNATASIDISGLTNGSTTVGSIAGNGAVYLGGNNLTVGTNNTSTIFSGVIQDGGLSGGVEGQLTKTGTGTLTLTNVNTYTGTTTVDGGVLEITSTAAINSISGIYTGYLTGSTATLKITGGGTVSTSFGRIGTTGGTGTVTVSGAGSTWTNSSFIQSSAIHVGEFGGTGTMNILNGGTVSSDGGIIGDFGTGTVTVDGPGSNWTTTGDLQVGDSGTGAMSITGGGMVSNNNAEIGNNGTGTVTVDGPGSTWTNNGFLTVADSGMGTLSITHGAKVSASDGANINAQGTVTVGTVTGDAASLISPTVAVMTGGLLTGTGTIKGNDAGGPSMVTNDGVVSPGDGASLGTLHLIGSYVQNSGGTFSITIGSLSFFDALDVSGAATLSGTLDVTLAGYTGNAGDVFMILHSSFLTGNFTLINLPSLSGGLFFTESTTGTDVLLTVNQGAGVPEPSTWAVGLLITGTLLSSFRRRRAGLLHPAR